MRYELSKSIFFYPAASVIRIHGVHVYVFFSNVVFDLQTMLHDKLEVLGPMCEIRKMIKLGATLLRAAHSFANIPKFHLFALNLNKIRRS